MRSSSVFALLVPALFLAACVAGLLSEPLTDAMSRATPLSFGLYVTPDPATNPIDPPERFTGYHVGTDFEVTQEELDQDVAVFALCTGEVAFSGFTEGYGGLVIQRCVINAEPVTVLYGHLVSAGLPAKGIMIAAGERMGSLAPARSTDSDGNRKHLHLGIHRGDEINYQGYVQTPEEMQAYIDPFTLLGSGFEGATGKLLPYWQRSE